MSSSADATHSTHGRAAFQYRDFRFYQLARLCSIVATEAQSTAIAWQVYEITRSPLSLGYVGLAQFLPGILLSLLAGHTADRFDRRRILQICNLGSLLCSLLLLAYVVRGAHRVEPIYAILVLTGIIRAFSGPASQSLLPQMVKKEHFPNAVAWGSSVFMLATILGPAIGGGIYAIASGPVLVYSAGAVLYFSTFIWITLLHVRTGRMEHKETSLHTLFAGFRYVWEKKIILGSISLDLFAVLLGGAVALLPVVADQILHVGPWGLGMLRSAPAVGAGLMGGLVAFRPIRKQAGAIMLWCVAIFGVSTIVFGLSRSFWVSMVAMLVLGASDMVSVIIRSTLVQIATPAEMRGRVSAVNLLFIGASNEFGQFESGLTAHWFGTIPAVIIGGVGSVIVVVAWALMFPALRKVDKLETAHE
jgi:MFS family permease